MSAEMVSEMRVSAQTNLVSRHVSLGWLGFEQAS